MRVFIRTQIFCLECSFGIVKKEARVVKVMAGINNSWSDVDLLDKICSNQNKAPAIKSEQDFEVIELKCEKTEVIKKETLTFSVKEEPHLISKEFLIEEENTPTETYFHTLKPNDSDPSTNRFYLKNVANEACYQCLLCEFKTKLKINIKRHFKNIHDENVEWYHCSLCDHKVKKKCNLETHFRNKHAETIAWHHCHLCEFKSKQKCTLKRHFSDKHDDDIEWHQCHLCNFRSKRKYNLKLHFNNKHTIITALHQCPLCELKFKQKYCLLKHFKYQHGNHEWHHCHLCNYKAKQKTHLRLHLENKHREMYHCLLCGFQYKQRAAFIKHLRNHKTKSE